MHYDVIIIGAGPAGLACAEALKDSKLTILVLEKNTVVGPKVCAGGLNGLETNFAVPQDKVRAFADNTFRINEKKYVITLHRPIMAIDRYELGQYQLKKLEGLSNITVKTNVFVKNIASNKVITNEGEYTFSHLVGADGSQSIVRRHLNLPSKICMAYNYNIPQITNEFIWYFETKDMGPGYIWEFPHQNFTSIGIYFDPKYLPSQKAKDLLHTYLIKHGYDYSKTPFEAAAVNYDYRGCVFGSTYLLGDAAGLTSALTGEGISFGIISGQEVAKKILHPNYRMPRLKKVLAFKRRQERIFTVMSKFRTLQPAVLYWGIRVLKHTWFQKYIGN